MCIMWLYIGDSKCGDTTQLIIASNRDEFLHRHTTGCKLRKPSEYKASIKRPKQKFIDDIDLPIRKAGDIYSGKNDGCDVVHRLGEDGEVGGGDTVFLGPRDEEGGKHGTWFVCDNRKRWAIVTNVRKPEGWLDFLNDPRIFAKLCYYLSFMFLGFYFYLASYHYERIHKEMDRRENMWHEVILDRWGDGPGASMAVDYIPVLLDLHVVPVTVSSVVCMLIWWCLKDTQYKVSRGYLPPSFVGSNLSAEKFAKHFVRQQKGINYDGFNMVFGDGNDCYHLTNRSKYRVGGRDIEAEDGSCCEVEKLEKGKVYGVSNAGLDTPGWQKLDKGRVLFSNVVRLMGCRGTYEHGLAPRQKMDRQTAGLTLISNVLGNTEKCRPAVTGCDDKLEEALAHIRVPVREVPWGAGKGKKDFHDGKVYYGTRTSMAIMMGWGSGSGSGGKCGGEDVQIWSKEYGVGGTEGLVEFSSF